MYNWQHITFRDKSNPYICTTEENFKHMKRKYKLIQIKPNFWLAEERKSGKTHISLFEAEN